MFQIFAAQCMYQRTEMRVIVEHAKLFPWWRVPTDIT